MSKINIKVYLIGVVLSLFSVGSSFLAYGISIWANAALPFPYYIVLLSFCFLYGFFAYLFGDLEYMRYKKEVGEYHPSVPEEERMKILARRIPFIIALIVTFIVLAIFFIVSLFLKRWPLL